MSIPTEPVGSLPRPARLQQALTDYDAGRIGREQLVQEQDAACLDTLKRMEATGSPIVSDGEQRVSSFATYPLTDTLAGTGLAETLAPDGQYFAIFTDGHHRQLPRLVRGPFRYKTYASQFVENKSPVVDMVRTMNAFYGGRIGTAYAEGFFTHEAFGLSGLDQLV